MLNDYSSILMRMESRVKELSYKCLHKKYEGSMAEIAGMHSDLTLLAVWISNQKGVNNERISEVK
jgi:hypothetical protein